MSMPTGFPRLRRHQAEPAPTARAPHRPGLALIADVLAREAIVGAVLWAGRAWGQQNSALLTGGVFALVIIGTRWFGLAQRRGWGLTLREALLVFTGGICLANIIAFAAAQPH
jgi:hypothetical protein